VFWTRDTGIDGETPVDVDELDLIPIDPLPSSVWYGDLADFAEGVSDDAAGRRLAQAMRGGEPSVGSRTTLFEEYSDLVPTWHAFRDAKAMGLLRVVVGDGTPHCGDDLRVHQGHPGRGLPGARHVAGGVEHPPGVLVTAVGQQPADSPRGHLSCRRCGVTISRHR